MGRYDNMARHCAECHGRYPRYLRKDEEPKYPPYNKHWKKRMDDPDMIWVIVDEDCSVDDQESQESEQSEEQNDNEANDANSFNSESDD